MPLPQNINDLVSAEDIADLELSNNVMLKTPNEVKEDAEKVDTDALLSAARESKVEALDFGNETTDVKEGGMSRAIYGENVNTADFESYNKYIDRPFSLISVVQCSLLLIVLPSKNLHLIRLHYRFCH